MRNVWRLMNLRFYRRHSDAAKRLRRNIRRRMYRETFTYWRLRYFWAWFKAFVTRRHFNIIPTMALLLALFSAGCATVPVNVQVTGHRAYYSIEEMRHFVQMFPREVPFMETIRMVTIVNPSTEDVVFDCDGEHPFRVKVKSGEASTFRLDDSDDHCDLQNDTLYSPNTGVQ